MKPIHAHSNRLAYTRTEAAKLLGVSSDTIDSLRKRGLLKCSLATRRPLFPLWELERFLRETSAEIDPEPVAQTKCFSRNGPRQGNTRSGRKVERSLRAIPCDEQDLETGPEGPGEKSTEVA